LEVSRGRKGTRKHFVDHRVAKPLGTLARGYWRGVGCANGRQCQRRHRQKGEGAGTCSGPGTDQSHPTSPVVSERGATLAAGIRANPVNTYARSNYRRMRAAGGKKKASPIEGGRPPRLQSMARQVRVAACSE